MLMAAIAPRFSFTHLRNLSNFVRMPSSTLSLNLCFPYSDSVG
jgi:hypothetical protein